MIAMFTARLLLRSPSWRRLSWRCRRPGPPRRRNSRLCSAPSYERQQKRINSWTVGLAGLIEGAPLRPAMEMAHVVDDGTNLLVLPTVRLGMTERLYVRGADLAIINSGICALLAQAERLECLEKLSHDIAPPSPPAVSPSPD
jgi:hypothetical protein